MTFCSSLVQKRYAFIPLVFCALLLLVLCPLYVGLGAENEEDADAGEAATQAARNAGDARDALPEGPTDVDGAEGFQFRLPLFSDILALRRRPAGPAEPGAAPLLPVLARLGALRALTNASGLATRDARTVGGRPRLPGSFFDFSSGARFDPRDADALVRQLEARGPAAPAFQSGAV